MFAANVIAPALAFINSQQNPDPMLAVGADIEMGLLQTRIALLCTAPSSVVSESSSMTGRFQDGSLSEIQGQSAPKDCRSMMLFVCPTQNVSLSDAGVAGEARSMVSPSRKFV